MKLPRRVSYLGGEMRDPHVESLSYRLTTDETTSFKNPPQLTFETDDFEATLAGDILNLKLKDHFATREEAREHVEPFLRAWEIDQALRSNGLAEISFEFQKAKLIDRDPSPPGTPQTIKAAGIVSTVSVGMVAIGHVIRARYPPAPNEI
jgi:hypothetical protein